MGAAFCIRCQLCWEPVSYTHLDVYKRQDLKQSDLDYKVREENLDAQVKAEEKRTEELKEYKIYVKTKQYAEEIAKEKLGLVNPDEILLKPTE